MYEYENNTHSYVLVQCVELKVVFMSRAQEKSIRN